MRLELLIKMNREELIKVICSAVLEEPILCKEDMENSFKCGRKTDYKCGLYFLYDNND